MTRDRVDAITDALLTERNLVLCVTEGVDGRFYWDTLYADENTPHDSCGPNGFNTRLEAAEAAHHEHADHDIEEDGDPADYEAQSFMRGRGL